MPGKKTLVIGMFTMFPVMVFFTRCFDKPAFQPDVRGEKYAGSASCQSCHKDIYTSYVHTAHFQTSKPASVKNVHGSFSAGHNVFNVTANQKVVMVKVNAKMYQAGFVNGKKTNEQPFNITVGGIKAETYLYWQNSTLLELPISYFKTINSWTNSPGYATDHVNFSRPVVTRCLECHASYIYEIPQQTLTKNTVKFDSTALIYGIDCERCHGPAAGHVNFHTDNPEAKKAKFIVSFKALTRTQKLDACAVCHSGNTEKFITSAFNFKPGDTLANFKVRDFFPEKPDPLTVDVHGNQNGMLASSKCFLMSNMDCTTCHNTHVNERGNTLLYTQKCINCHNISNHNICKIVKQTGNIMQSKCIDCHMPAMSSHAITVQTGDKNNATPYRVRTHRIAVYPEEAKRILAFAAKSDNLKNN